MSVRPARSVSAAAVLNELKAMYARRGIEVDVGPDMWLRDLGFRSLDFSELVLRIERQVGGQLNFRAEQYRRIERVQDLLDFFLRASEASRRP